MFCDIKYEMGLFNDQVIISDVLDLDNMRIIDRFGFHYDKQLFRDGVDIVHIKSRYLKIAHLIYAHIK
ncbi:phosphoribosylaminoimidazolesuccinocarboxamide synthase [Patescibacteria group bacterium]